MASGGSQAGAYGALIAGGVLAVAGFSGHSLRDVLAGKSSPIKGLISTPPEGEAQTSTGMASWLQGANGAAVGIKPGGSAAGATNGATGNALSAGGYVFPLGPGWTQERTDQGVDFAPSHTGAPIFSPGKAKILKIGAPGWPSGEKGVLLQLLDGPLKGRIVYIYEAIDPTVRAGQIVSAGQQIGQGVFGETGIEIGFADSAGAPLSHGEYTEGKVTTWGTRMAEWLATLKRGGSRTLHFGVRNA